MIFLCCIFNISLRISKDISIEDDVDEPFQKCCFQNRFYLFIQIARSHTEQRHQVAKIWSLPLGAFDKHLMRRIFSSPPEWSSGSALHKWQTQQTLCQEEADTNSCCLSQGSL